MTAKPTFPPAETTAGPRRGEPIRPAITALKPGMTVVKKSGDTEFIGTIINLGEIAKGEVRITVQSIAPGARHIFHIYRPDQFRAATIGEIGKIERMAKLWDGKPANTAPSWLSPSHIIQPGRFPEMGGDPEPLPVTLDPLTATSPLPILAERGVRADPEFMPAWAHKALIAIVAIGAAFCAVMVWQSLAAINAALAPV